MISDSIEPMIEGMLEFFESEYINHEPEMQEALINYAKALAVKLERWTTSKITKD